MDREDQIALKRRELKGYETPMESLGESEYPNTLALVEDLNAKLDGKNGMFDEQIQRGKSAASNLSQKRKNELLKKMSDAVSNRDSVKSS